jgi:hypothetical protein
LTSKNNKLTRICIYFEFAEEEPRREYKNLSVAYDLGCIAFSDTTNTVYTFHLDAYFQAYPLFLSYPENLPPISKAIVYTVAKSAAEESDEEESDEEEEEEAEEENELEGHKIEKKNFTHWFEVFSLTSFSPSRKISIF